ncbi:MAG: hypothetical protein ACOYEV_05955 [Candidatus Nanopelagicales bacterium]
MNPGTHWRLYAVYTDRLDPATAAVGDGRTLGLPGLDVPPELVPFTADNGEIGSMEYSQLAAQPHPGMGLSVPSASVPVFGADGTSVIGTIDLTRTVPRPVATDFWVRRAGDRLWLQAAPAAVLTSSLSLATTSEFSAVTA